MKFSQLNILGISTKTKEDFDINVTDLIALDEFNRSGKDYRKSAIDRLITNNLPISNNNNISFDLVKSFVSIQCPYCGNKMVNNGGGADSHVSSHNFTCKSCGSEATLSLLHTSGLNFKPKY